jgi:hypothetical protein
LTTNSQSQLGKAYKTASNTAIQQVHIWTKRLGTCKNSVQVYLGISHLANAMSTPQWTMIPFTRKRTPQLMLLQPTLLKFPKDNTKTCHAASSILILKAARTQVVNNVPLHAFAT